MRVTLRPDNLGQVLRWIGWKVNYGAALAAELHFRPLILVRYRGDVAPEVVSVGLILDDLIDCGVGHVGPPHRLAQVSQLTIALKGCDRGWWHDSPRTVDCANNGLRVVNEILLRLAIVGRVDPVSVGQMS